MFWVAQAPGLLVSASRRNELLYPRCDELHRSSIFIAAKVRAGEDAITHTQDAHSTVAANELHAFAGEKGVPALPKKRRLLQVSG